jgi:hypothetical protein
VFPILGQSGEGILLFKRNKTYYCRIWIPMDMRKHFSGRRDIKKSLKTHDAMAAKTAALSFYRSMESFFMGVRLGMLTEDDIKKIRSKIIGETIEDL